MLKLLQENANQVRVSFQFSVILLVCKISIYNLLNFSTLQNAPGCGNVRIFNQIKLYFHKKTRIFLTNFSLSISRGGCAERPFFQCYGQNVLLLHTRKSECNCTPRHAVSEYKILHFSKMEWKKARAWCERRAMKPAKLESWSVAQGVTLQLRDRGFSKSTFEIR
jgi:hypothetical protein